MASWLASTTFGKLEKNVVVCLIQQPQLSGETPPVPTPGESITFGSVLWSKNGKIVSATTSRIEVDLGGEIYILRPSVRHENSGVRTNNMRGRDWTVL